MRPYGAHPFRRSTNLTIINGPLLTNFGLLRARFFDLYALYTFLFNFNFVYLCFARSLCFLCLLFSLFSSFFASNLFARNRTISFPSNSFYYYLSCLLFACNRLLHLSVYCNTFFLNLY